jgi:hypothetical protein
MTDIVAAQPPPVAVVDKAHVANLLHLQSLRDRAEREPHTLDESYWRERSRVYAACLLATTDFR